eukprot:NP_001337578.1 uncharacterized protein LOC100133204 [Homo sapiens]
MVRGSVQHCSLLHVLGPRSPMPPGALCTSTETQGADRTYTIRECQYGVYHIVELMRKQTQKGFWLAQGHTACMRQCCNLKPGILSLFLRRFHSAAQAGVRWCYLNLLQPSPLGSGNPPTLTGVAGDYSSRTWFWLQLQFLFFEFWNSTYKILLKQMTLMLGSEGPHTELINQQDRLATN